ncbi:hypothetical protein LTR78_004189 [Recurvomyces mirabilis]|uniref:DUF7907 domain-containing protein n=1 Tax=Recurvomyces mirabilis TaxID=574656 RepID=A0AAE0WQH9_9PEZI|nr:hypothetical protein LTR78_004189 [Recurvomyces mirabilis]KAK5153641.1 hypothetical protein LTS14_007335 [Recurvomyces mirabilis]
MLTLLASLLFTTLATAQYNQSAPFYLQLLSKNHTLNGTILGACHEGAAIEGLCAFGTLLPNATATLTYASFQFNTSSFAQPADVYGTPGYLTYDLMGSNFNLSEPLSLSVNPTSNVAGLLFEPSYASLEVAFDKHNLMNIQSTSDDSVSPIAYVNKAYYRWYVCTTNLGYTYQTLAWVVGKGKPQNPTCVATNITRVFA